MSAGPGINVTSHATQGDLLSQREAATEALADRVRGGEKLMLLCHCVPFAFPCHGQVLAAEILRRARSGPSRAGELPMQLRELYNAWRSEAWDPGAHEAA